MGQLSDLLQRSRLDESAAISAWHYDATARHNHGVDNSLGALDGIGPRLGNPLIERHLRTLSEGRSTVDQAVTDLFERKIVRRVKKIVKKVVKRPIISKSAVMAAIPTAAFAGAVGYQLSKRKKKLPVKAKLGLGPTGPQADIETDTPR